MQTTQLQRAAWRGDLITVRRLLDRGVSVDERGVAGMTPLMFAAKEGRVAIVRRLIAAGADVRARAAKTAIFAGLYPVHFAVSAAQLPARTIERTLAALLQSGADVNVKDADGWTPLHYVAARPRPRRRVLSALLRAGGDPNALAREGTPLTVLCRLANPRTSWWVAAAEMLVEGGADSEIENRPLHEESPRSLAVAAWNDRLLRILSALPANER
jgi:ankyrin repeat protein